MSSTRPNPFSQFVSDRGVRLAAGLAIVVAIPMAVLFYFQFRSLNDIEKTSAVVLRQLSSDTAESLTRSIEDYLKRPHISVLLRMPQARTEPLDLAWIDPVFRDGLKESPFVDSFFVWTERGPRANKWLGLRPAPASRNRPARRSSGSAKTSVFGAKLLPPPARAGEDAHGDRRLHRRDQRPEVLRAGAAALRVARARAHDQRGGASRSTRKSSAPSSSPRCCAIGSPTCSSRSGFPPLEVDVLDEDGDAHFRVGPARSDDVPVDERSFAIIFFDKELLEFAAPYEQQREIWGLRTGYGPQTIPEIVSASTRPQMALMIVLAVAMALGVFLVAGAAAREVRVAELKSNFVASVSHDLKTPLALIQLFAETLELGRVRTPDRAQEYYRIINGEAKKLTRLIENILDFSRMEAGLRPYRMEPADLAESVTKVLARMDTQFAQGHFTVTDLDRARPAARAGRRRRRRAGDREPAGQRDEVLGRAARSTSRRAAPTATSWSRVTDHGIGISRREQGRIFRKFYRVQRELGGGPQGTGLGLAIVDHTMRGHGGFVDVDSEPNQGSTFTLHFPIPARTRSSRRSPSQRR